MFNSGILKLFGLFRSSKVQKLRLHHFNQQELVIILITLVIGYTQLVQHNIEDAMAEVMYQLEQHRKIRERKRSLNSLNRVHSSINNLTSLFASGDQTLDPLVLERAAAEFNQMHFNISRCKDDLSAFDKKVMPLLSLSCYYNLEMVVNISPLFFLYMLQLKRVYQ